MSIDMTAPATLAARKLLLKPEEAAKVLSIGRTLLFELVRTEQVRSIQIGRLRRFRMADLEEFTSQLANCQGED